MTPCTHHDCGTEYGRQPEEAVFHVYIGADWAGDSCVSHLGDFVCEADIACRLVPVDAKVEPLSLATAVHDSADELSRDAVIGALFADPTVEAVGYLLMALDRIGGAVERAKSLVTSHLHEQQDTGKALLGSLGVNVPNGSRSYWAGEHVVRVGYRKANVGWKGDDLLNEVVARGLDERRIDRETGEALESEADAVVRAIRTCSSLTNASAGWRVTALRKRGIDPERFQSKGEWVPTAGVAYFDPLDAA